MQEILQNVPIETLIPYENNYLDHKNNAEHISNSIKDFDFTTPIEVDENNVILAGHGRLEAAKSLGMTTIPNVLKISGWDDKKKSAYRFANNTTGLKAEIDYTRAGKELEFIGHDFQLDNYGLDMRKFNKIDLVDDIAPPAPETPRTVKGDIYQLGNHRVMCGDSAIITDVEKLMAGNFATLTITDPPYGIGFKYNKHIDIKGDEYEQFCNDWFNNIEVVTENRNIIIFTGWAYNGFWLNKKPYDIFYWIVKNKHSGGKNSHFRNTEPVIMFSRFIKQFDFDFIIYDSIQKIKGAGEEHSCPKPVKLFADFINNSTNQERENICLDIFLGSGTTLIACEQTNRICYGMELDEKYCDVIVQRWVNFTGGKVILNGNEIEWPQTEPK